MTDLIVLGFDGIHKADEALLQLEQLEKEHLIHMEDAAVVVRMADGSIKIRQTQDLTAAATLTGGVWGLLVGALLANPLIGIAVGSGMGALSGASADIGINDDFIEELAETLSPDSSAVFLLVKQATLDKVMADLRPFKGRLLHTSMSLTTKLASRLCLSQKLADSE
jgi:uncharacterized membrane protein